MQCPTLGLKRFARPGAEYGIERPLCSSEMVRSSLAVLMSTLPSLQRLECLKPLLPARLMRTAITEIENKAAHSIFIYYSLRIDFSLSNEFDSVFVSD